MTYCDTTRYDQLYVELCRERELRAILGEQNAKLFREIVALRAALIARFAPVDDAENAKLFCDFFS